MGLIFRLLSSMFILSALAGCSAALDGFPNRSTNQAKDLEALEPYLGVAKVNVYIATKDDGTRLKLRNEIVNARIHAIDANFGNFEEALHRQGVGIGIGTDWVLLAITGATATIGGQTFKAALGAASTGILGAKSSFDKHALFEKTVPAIMAQMVASRKTALVTLRTGLQLPDSGYSLFQALGDLETYYRAGTIPGSLVGIAKAAGTKATTAEEKLTIILNDSKGKADVEAARQQEVADILSNISKLSKDSAIGLNENPPVQTIEIEKIVALRDPTGRRLIDEKVAKEMLKMRVVLGKRNNATLNAWEAATKTAQN